jgi:hypothetical protein
MESVKYKRGDWVTLSEPYFGRRAVVADVRVKLMTVAYLNSSGQVDTRDVLIDSVASGHDSRGRGPEEVFSDLADDLKPEHARELAEFAVRNGFIGQMKADALVDAYTANNAAAREQSARKRIEADQKILAAWLATGRPRG